MPEPQDIDRADDADAVDGLFQAISENLSGKKLLAKGAVATAVVSFSAGSLDAIGWIAARPEAIAAQFFAEKAAWIGATLVLVNCLMRLLTRDWSHAGRWFITYVGLTALFLALARESHVGHEPEVLLAILYGIGSVAFICVELIVKWRIFDATGKTGTARVREFVVSSDAKIAELASGSSNTRIGRRALALMNDPGRNLLSPYKVAIVAIFSYLAIVHGALATGAQLGHAIHSHSGDSVVGIKAINPKPQNQRGHGHPPTLMPPETAIVKYWDQICPAAPGYDAPRWTRHLFYALYLGGNPELGTPPGAPSGGCTGATFVPERGNGELAYELGRDPATGDLMSVAVVSRRFGAAIYLAPAARAILGLIHSGEIIAGPPRQDVGNGDIYVIEGTRGLYALVRPQKTAGASEMAARYVELGPAAVSAWAAAMADAHGWLWPIGRRRGTGSDSVTLVRSVLVRKPTSVDAIVFDANGDWAYRRSGGGWLGSGSSSITPTKILSWTSSAK